MHPKKHHRLAVPGSNTPDLEQATTGGRQVHGPASEEVFCNRG
jgi:hypothetical protein